MRSYVVLAATAALAGCQGKSLDEQVVELRIGQVEMAAKHSDERVAALSTTVQGWSDRLDKVRDASEASRRAQQRVADTLQALADEATQTVTAAHVGQCREVCAAALVSLQRAVSRTTEDVAALRDQEGKLQIRLAELGASSGLAKELARVGDELVAKRTLRAALELQELRLLADATCQQPDTLNKCQVAITSRALLIVGDGANGDDQSAKYLCDRFRDEAGKAMALVPRATGHVPSAIDIMTDGPGISYERAQKMAAAKSADKERSLGELRRHVEMLEDYLVRVKGLSVGGAPVDADNFAMFQAQLTKLRQELAAASGSVAGGR